MTYTKVKHLLDFITVAILIILVINLMRLRLNDELIFTWRHWLGILLVLITCYVFSLNHRLGILALGLTLILGLLSVTQYSPGYSVTSLYWTPFDVRIPIFYGKPIFLLWVVLHFVLSGRYYVGILTKNYWDNLFLSLKKN